MEDANSTAPSRPQTPSASAVAATQTDEERLEHAMELARKKISATYESYHEPELSKDQKDKFGQCMIAWMCKM
ncbi:hypothetical protein KEM48_012169 [Puccinia striiformis f. sp. tritici PST-130]|nr:hypothetical protein KEM48_012169 [Puccinia striiformis f. sp. tritici PST-130]